MTERQNMLNGQLYNAQDPELVAERIRAKELCREYNSLVSDDEPAKKRILNELIGHIEGDCIIEPNFHCDYGSNISLGKNFYANFDLIILDVCEVRIGDNCMCAPRVCITTGTHPVDAELRASAQEYGEPITIGNNVWLGAGVIVNPGVTIGDSVTVASGAVVTKDVESNMLVGGVPAKVIRTLNKQN